VKEKFVWHGVVSVDTDDGHLSAGQWDDIATTVTDHLGFNPDSETGVRWIAVHHGDSAGGNDHVHLVANLINDDGRKHKFIRPPGVMMGEVRKDLELKHGLKLVGHDTGNGLGTYNQAETRRAEEQRQNTAAEKAVPVQSVKAAEPETVRLERRVRAAASAATDESDFLHHLQEQEVAVRPRFATGDRTRVVGMSVALPTGDGQTLIWHGGGRLAKDLTLPAIRTQWGQTTEQQSAAVDVWHQLGVGGTTKTDTADTVQPAEALTPAPVGQAPPADLQSRVRTAAASAAGEAEFLAQLHAQGVVVRPRFATGDSTTVVGMSVALPTGNTGNTLDWHGAGKLGKDLSLPALRERWGQTPEQQTAAVGAWRQLGAVGKQLGDRTDTDPAGKRPKNQNPDFAAAIADIGGVAGPRSLGWGHRVGGAAAWPLRPGPPRRTRAAGGDPRPGGPADESDECGAAQRRHRQSAARRVGRGVPRPGPHRPGGGRGATQPARRGVGNPGSHPGRGEGTRVRRANGRGRVRGYDTTTRRTGTGTGTGRGADRRGTQRPRRDGQAAHQNNPPDRGQRRHQHHPDRSRPGREKTRPRTRRPAPLKAGSHPTLQPVLLASKTPRHSLLRRVMQAGRGLRPARRRGAGPRPRCSGRRCRCPPRVH